MPFLNFLPQQRLLSGSLEFDFLRQIVCAKNTWKSSATATKEIPKGQVTIYKDDRVGKKQNGL